MLTATKLLKKMLLLNPNCHQIRAFWSTSYIFISVNYINIKFVYRRIVCKYDNQCFIVNTWVNLRIYIPLKESILSFSRTPREKCPNTEFFLVRIFLYSDSIQENMGQKILRIHFSRHHLDVFCKKAFRKNFVNFTEKHWYQRLFFFRNFPKHFS